MLAKAFFSLFVLTAFIRAIACQEKESTEPEFGPSHKKIYLSEGESVDKTSEVVFFVFLSLAMGGIVREINKSFKVVRAPKPTSILSITRAFSQKLSSAFMLMGKGGGGTAYVQVAAPARMHKI